MTGSELEGRRNPDVSKLRENSYKGKCLLSTGNDMSYHYWDIPELADLEAGRNLVRVPMQQDVPFSERVRALVDTPEFQRLRQISQLGLVSRVYPGATHSRFEHALGVYHNALRYLRQLSRDARFREIIDPHWAEVLIVAALLHDLGHWPFCHPIEDMALPELPPHEAFAERFLSPDRALGERLQKVWGIEPREVLNVLVHASETSPASRIVGSILSGPIDVDKMDYLERDSLHCGVPYGRHFDKNRLIHSLQLNEAGDGLAITNKGKTAAELMVFARYVMFSEVYWHHAVRSATSMFARAFFGLYKHIDLQRFFESREADAVELLLAAAAGRDELRLLEGVFGVSRRLYKRVCEFSFAQHPEMYTRFARRSYDFLVRCSEVLAELFSSDLGKQVRPVDVLIDAPPPHREVEFRVDVYYPKEACFRPLQEVSPVVDALARVQFDDHVKRVRVFAAPEWAHRLARLPKLNERLVEAVELAEKNI